MAEATLGRRALREVVTGWRRLNWEQRAAALAATLLVVSTFGPFSFVEAAEVLVGAGVLALLRARAHGKRFHLPFGDGTVIVAAGGWAALLIVVRLFDRPLGQNLLALACAAILALAGAAERAKRPPDDLPAEDDWLRWAGEPGRAGAGASRPRPEGGGRERPAAAAGAPVQAREATGGESPPEPHVEPLPPPEYEPPESPA